jgi:hypothetical protein
MKQTFLFILLNFVIISFSLAQEEIYDNSNKNNNRIETSEELPKDDNTTIRNNKRTNNNEIEEDEKENEEESTKKFDPSKLRIGGNFGLQFGSYTYVNLSPTVGYLFLKDRLQLGAGPIFIYQSIRYTNNFRQKSFVYGADIYARGYVWKGVYLQAQYDLVNKESYYNFGQRLNVHHLLLGGGYAQPIGNAASFYISMLYNVINNDESVYQGTFGKIPLILNIGFGIGINKRN